MHPVQVVPETDEEKYIIEEMKLHCDETAFLSSIDEDNVHIRNVIDLGKNHLDFLMKLVKESVANDFQYAHFLLCVMFSLYDIKVEGYVGVSECMNMLIQLYDSGILKYE